MRYSRTSHTGYDPTTRTTIFQSRRYSATSWEVLVVLKTKASQSIYWSHIGMKLFKKYITVNYSKKYIQKYNFYVFWGEFSHF